jgi:hypothetical protein
VPKATTSQSITGWTKIADAGQTFLLSVLGGTIHMIWSASSPSPTDLGHPWFANDSYAEAATTQNCWVRSVGDGNAVIVVSKE